MTGGAEIRYSGWGRALSAKATLARPERLSDIVALGPAVGGRRSYGDAALNDGGMAVDMRRLDRIIAFDIEKGEIESEAGITLGDLARVTIARGWLPAVLPGTGHATLGGAIAMDVHGKNHHGAGSFGQHVLGFDLISPTGGQRRVKPGQPLFAATMGGLGQTGIVTSARIKLTHAPGAVVALRERRVADWAAHVAALTEAGDSYAVGWIDATAQGRDLGRGIVETAELSAGEARRRGGRPNLPFDAPRLALSAPIVRAFNAAYFHRVPLAGRDRIVPYEAFFFPLDAIGAWNRLYGHAGFHQFQCVVPPAAADGLRDMLAEIAAGGFASPLAVLKRMGPGRAGMMSFPMEGLTLAVDMPNRTGVVALIARLSQQAADLGGRVYLAKDSAAEPAALDTMYPEAAKWRQAVAKADPAGRMVTDLVRRLKLRETA